MVIFWIAVVYLAEIYSEKHKNDPPEVCWTQWYAERRLGIDMPLGTDLEQARAKAGGRMIYSKCL